MSTVLDSLKKLVVDFLRGKDPYEVAVENFIKELQKTLLRADVNVKLVLQLTNSIRERALKEKPPPLVSRNEWFIKIVYDELSNLFGGDVKPQVFPQKTPYIIMLVGVQGSGKTTTAAKIAYFYKRYGYRPCLVCADTYRPAAYDQLSQLSKQIDVPFCGEQKSTDAVNIAKKCTEWCINQNSNIVIIDTAGRHGYGEEEALLKEMQEIAKSVNPDEIMMILDASMGQKAYELALRFHSATPIGSITITKLDGTAKGGGALSAVAATKAIIKFIGVGEKIPEIEVFEPRRFVGRLLGLGDISTLIEKLKSIEHSEEVEKRFAKALSTGKITLADIYLQLQTMRKLGPLAKIVQLIPGLSMMPIDDKQMKITEEKMRKWLAIIDSMTYEELRNPSIIDKNRMVKIAIGSGTTIEDVKELLKYYELVNTMIKNIKRRKTLFKKFGIDLAKISQEQ
ncbi:signal recognition particle protein Srp54 [Ignisphaera sp. 4213-co]|uniref:Signal recognition particle 54 kDa protein n=1 Tax=Ignisphaera cupida TaxID=3050454 RepID=A0ABD4Z9B0_9CREN|nr:signal recognition particle protein Srp54 [Ignisphaera sp. 4213-co]MDK6029507.1 signal recognition particle protein Srp54 [Ignisphaera sp. 4213-co]